MKAGAQVPVGLFQATPKFVGQQWALVGEDLGKRSWTKISHGGVAPSPFAWRSRLAGAAECETR
jgi:hypothetical protein